MRFWQKAFICIVALFLVGLDLTGIVLTRRSYALVQENTCRTAEAEEQGIENSLYTAIALSLRQYHALNAENLRVTIKPYADYYQTQGVYLAVYQNGEPQFTSFPGSVDYQGFQDKMTANVAEPHLIDGRLYCVILSRPDGLYDNLQLVYFKDIQTLADFGKEITRSTVLICTVVSLALAAVLLVFLIGLTRPFRKLNAAASEITAGHYNQRVTISGRDEVGQFAASFNKMADSVEAKIAEMTAVNEMKETFINNLSHEMRTPITATIGYAELLQIGNCSEEEQATSIDYIIAQGRRLRSMSEKLMHLADLNGGQVEKQPVSWEAVLSASSLTCTPLMREKNVRLEQRVEADSIMGDGALLESLLQNLLENAVKASPEGGTVLVSVWNKKGSVLEVADDGQGMEPGEAAKVTEPFYRVDKARSRAEGGAGLGLSICARICEAHGARLTFHSIPGKGTTVRVAFGQEETHHVS